MVSDTPSKSPTPPLIDDPFAETVSGSDELPEEHTPEFETEASALVDVGVAQIRAVDDSYGDLALTYHFLVEPDGDEATLSSVRIGYGDHEHEVVVPGPVFHYLRLSGYFALEAADESVDDAKELLDDLPEMAVRQFLE